MPFIRWRHKDETYCAAPLWNLFVYLSCRVLHTLCAFYWPQFRGSAADRDKHDCLSYHLTAVGCALNYKRASSLCPAGKITVDVGILSIIVRACQMRLSGEYWMLDRWSQNIACPRFSWSFLNHHYRWLRKTWTDRTSQSLITCVTSKIMDYVFVCEAVSVKLSVPHFIILLDPLGF
jgi:hypothetical protein